MPTLLVSDKSGRIFDIPEFEAAGMKGGYFFRLEEKDLVKMPSASRLFMLPDRIPVGYNPKTGNFRALDNYFAVACFMTPGFTSTYSAAYQFPLPCGGEGRVKGFGNILPLYCYTAVSFHKGEFYAAGFRIDRSFRHDPRFIDIDLVRKNVKEVKRLFPRNRLISHLTGCATVYGCPGAQNFFLGKYECPLPVSPYCNASCAGCISYQKPCRGQACLPPTQPRIKFIPSPQEVKEVALYHLSNVKHPVLSFGQGCEGEPLLQADLIEKSIRLIRRETNKGTININTNASKSESISRLLDAGLDSIRVSMNSVRREYYNRYYRPVDYTFRDVLKSIKITGTAQCAVPVKKSFVSINYLTMLGFTDLKDEFDAFKRFIETYRIDMVQWRNLNFDPLEYFRIIKCHPEPSNMLGIRHIIESLRKSFPRLKMGYYNPSL